LGEKNINKNESNELVPNSLIYNTTNTMALQFCELFPEVQFVSPIFSHNMIRRDSGILT